MSLPADLLYTTEHEWIRVDDRQVTIGITEHAQESLGDVVYLELPREGESVTKDDPFGVIESVKAVSDLYSPVNGSVIEVNEPLTNTPEVINDDPYGEAWMLKVEIKGAEELDGLFTPEEYKQYLEEEK